MRWFEIRNIEVLSKIRDSLHLCSGDPFTCMNKGARCCWRMIGWDGVDGRQEAGAYHMPSLPHTLFSLTTHWDA